MSVLMWHARSALWREDAVRFAEDALGGVVKND